jgi:hypothetical protein
MAVWRPRFSATKTVAAASAASGAIIGSKMLRRGKHGDMIPSWQEPCRSYTHGVVHKAKIR